MTRLKRKTLLSTVILCLVATQSGCGLFLGFMFGRMVGSVDTDIPECATAENISAIYSSDIQAIYSRTAVSGQLRYQPGYFQLHDDIVAIYHEEMPVNGTPAEPVGFNGGKQEFDVYAKYPQIDRSSYFISGDTGRASAKIAGIACPCLLHRIKGQDGTDYLIMIRRDNFLQAHQTLGTAMK